MLPFLCSSLLTPPKQKLALLSFHLSVSGGTVRAGEGSVWTGCCYYEFISSLLIYQYLRFPMFLRVSFTLREDLDFFFFFLTTPIWWNLLVLTCCRMTVVLYHLWIFNTFTVIRLIVVEKLICGKLHSWSNVIDFNLTGEDSCTGRIQRPKSKGIWLGPQAA